MGCSESKGTETQDQSKKPADKKPAEKKPDAKKPEEKPADDSQKQEENKEEEEEDPFVDKERAIKYIMKELNVSEESATKMVERANADGDDKIEGAELKALWKDVCLARDKLKPMFEEADKDKSGKVTVDEASTILAKEFDKMDEAGLKKLLKNFDSGDGKIVCGEFIFFYFFLQKSRAELRPIFESCDTNGTGVVTFTEAIAKLMEIYPNMEEKPLKRMLYRFENGDGNIKYEEFIGFMTQLKMNRNTVLKKFEKLDKDDDGKVSQKAVIKLLSEETGMDEDECKTLLNEDDEGNEGNKDKVTAAEFLNTWSKIVGAK